MIFGYFLENREKIYHQTLVIATKMEKPLPVDCISATRHDTQLIVIARRFLVLLGQEQPLISQSPIEGATGTVTEVLILQRVGTETIYHRYSSSGVV